MSLVFGTCPRLGWLLPHMYSFSKNCIILYTSYLSSQLEVQECHFSSALTLKTVTRMYNALINRWIKMAFLFSNASSFWVLLFAPFSVIITQTFLQASQVLILYSVKIFSQERRWNLVLLKCKWVKKKKLKDNIRHNKYRFLILFQKPWKMQKKWLSKKRKGKISFKSIVIYWFASECVCVFARVCFCM